MPGAIRDVLAPYAVGRHYCLEILPLLNPPDSLEITDEFWDSPNHDVALSVRFAAAAVIAFVITPPHRVLHNFVTPNNVHQGWQHRQAILGQAIPFWPRGDADSLFSRTVDNSARLENLVRLLPDMLWLMHLDWWMSNNADSTRRERRVLFDARHT
jgi:hypothetical protein